MRQATSEDHLQRGPQPLLPRFSGDYLDEWDSFAGWRIAGILRAVHRLGIDLHLLPQHLIQQDGAGSVE
jgi:hypothetical protein